jgi:Tripartite tricarboxylate transporter family receptor
VGISESRKNKAETPPIVSKTRQTQRRPKAKLHRHPIRISASNLPRRQFLHLAAGAAALPAMPRVSRAQAFPSRPVTMIVPSAAGGGLDAVGRMLAERMRVLLGQPVVIENVTGANGSIGVGRAARAADTRFAFVPYRGGAPALQDLVAGQIDLIFAPAADASEQIRGGSIKAYAVLAKARLAKMPDIPTVDEAGFPGVYFSNWYGFWTPARTPKDIIATLNAAAVEALATRRCVLGSPISARKFSRATSRRPRCSAPFKRPKSRNGGQSSRRSASKESEPAAAGLGQRQ